MFKNQIFSILFFILQSLTLPIYSYEPLGTYAHSTALVDNKLYVIGGIDLSAVSVTFKNVFYLNLSSNFEVDSPSWVDLSSDSSVPFYGAWATAAVGGRNNQTIYLFGGIQFNDSQTDAYKGFTWQFDTISKIWSQPGFLGTEPIRRREMDAVSGADGKIYIFSGIYDTVLGASSSVILEDMIIVETLDREYTYGTTTGMPLGRVDYTATILSNGIIVYIGGWDVGMVSLSNISTYNTISNTWENITASSDSSFEARYGHSAVLTTDGRIIVYGGLNFNGYTPSPILIVLDTNTFKWSSPSTSGSPEAEPVIYHSADIYDKYMIIAFGNLTSTTTDPTGPRRVDYTATILSNGIIVYIGGWDVGMVSLSNISTYNTISNTWENITASSDSSFEARYGHSAVLTTDGRIIVYGGLNFNGYTPSPILIVLDTNTFKWSSPSTSGSPEAEPVIYHSADIYDKYMIIAFGNLTSTTTDPTGPSSQIYILDSNGYFVKFVRYIEGNENKEVIIPAYIKRPVEQSNSKMHILHHIVGVTFYLPICLSTFIEGMGNLGVYGGGKDKNNFTFPPLTNFLTWNILLGVSLFYMLFITNLQLSKFLHPFDLNLLPHLPLVILNKGEILTSHLDSFWFEILDLWGEERFCEKWPNRLKIFPAIYSILPIKYYLLH
ncbi:hypothetical protein Glove_227g155 [Diversispora epigaea]|uniref:Galactose oxidase n=1 Tax=Diversispora epigaea TaxID=1348612 RepID=A0A397III1_9GLOM|nr:hypothetical protein Glove_227g155 [Diversispora epigaea]